MKNILKHLSFFAVVILCLTNTQCEDDDIIIDENGCGLPIIIDNNIYHNSITSEFTITNIEIIEENCLLIEFYASGCDGNSWEYKLIDSSDIAESSPEQRFLKFELTNNEACLAVFSRSVMYNLIPLKIEGSNEIILNINGFEDSITYTY